MAGGCGECNEKRNALIRRAAIGAVLGIAVFFTYRMIARKEIAR